MFDMLFRKFDDLIVSHLFIRILIYTLAFLSSFLVGYYIAL